MTERKPPDLSFTSWIDQQINEATERGAFDNLPGAGKPLPKRTDEDAAQAWLRDYLRREGVSADEMLPTPLRLRKEIERLTATVQDLRSEQEVRDVVADLNRQIVEWRRFPTGPPLFLPLVDRDLLLSKWRERHAAVPAEPPPPQATPPPPPHWWRRRRRSREA
jgi:DnaJ homologue, subfamily C, member 28, conserved domain